MPHLSASAQSSRHRASPAVGGWSALRAEIYTAQAVLATVWVRLRWGIQVESARAAGFPVDPRESARKARRCSETALYRVPAAERPRNAYTGGARPCDPWPSNAIASLLDGRAH